MRFLVVGMLVALLLAGCSGPQATSAEQDPGGSVEETIADVPTEAVVTNETGGIEGTVKNVNGAVIHAAHLALLGTQVSTTSASNGSFAMSEVSPGPHRLRVVATGYSGLERDITVLASKVTRLNITLVADTPGGPGFREHLHDRWAGETEITLFEGTVRHKHAYAPEGSNLLPCSRGSGVSFSGPNCYEMVIDFDEGKIVPPGADRVEVTVDFEASDQLPTVEILYLSADSDETQVTDPIGPGETAVIPVAYPMNDHGHQIRSLWSISILAEWKAAGISLSSQYFNEEFVGDFDVRVVVHKGDEMPSEPGHPRYWALGDTLLLHQDEEPVWFGGLPRTRDPSDMDCRNDAHCWMLEAGTIVPPGTTRLLVELDYTPRTAAAEPLLERKTLAFRTTSTHPADATLEDFLVVEPTTIEFGHTYYELRLEKDQVDAFYQSKSSWMFLLANEGDERGEQVTEDCYHYIVGCGGTDLWLTVTAVNDDWTPEIAGTS